MPSLRKVHWWQFMDLGDLKRKRIGIWGREAIRRATAKGGGSGRREAANAGGLEAAVPQENFRFQTAECWNIYRFGAEGARKILRLCAPPEAKSLRDPYESDVKVHTALQEWEWDSRTR